MADERAIIDIGSNTVRLVIYGGPRRAPAVLHNEKVTAKLGKAVAETGRLSEKATGSALAALRRYAALLAAMGIDDVVTVATAASRDAANGPEFLRAIEALGLRPRLLSGEEEALAAAQGVIAAFPGASGAVADLGGGSLELTAIAEGNAHHGTSLPLGSLRLPALRTEGVAKFEQKIHAMIAAAPIVDTSEAPLYLVGGSCRALAQVLMRREAWPLDDPHGYTLPADEASAAFRDIARSPPGTFGKGLSSSRAAALPDAAALMATVVQEVRPSHVVFSSWGLREGLLYAALDDPDRVQDPLLAGVTAFAEEQGVSAQLAAAVAGWTAGIGTGDFVAAEPVRLAAILVALASLRVEPNLRHEHATDWALRKRWVGVGAEGRAMMAMTALANAGLTDTPADFLRLAPPAALREAAAWGLALRLCRKAGGLAPQLLGDMALTLDAGGLRLQLGPQSRDLFTDAVDKHLKALAAWLGVPCQVVGARRVSERVSPSRARPDRLAAPPPW